MPQKDAIIGRVAVKVLPDTADFKRHLRRDLERIERTIDPLKVGLKLDTNNLSSQVKAASQQAKATADDIVLRVDLNGQESVRNSLNQLERELERLRETEIRVALNKGDLEAARDLMKERLDKISHIDLKVEAGNDASTKRAISQIDRELEKLREVPFSVRLDEKSLLAQRERLQKELDHAEALEINVKRDIAERIHRDVQNALSGITVRPDMDDREVRKGLRQIEKHLMKIEELKLTIKPEMDEVEKRKVEHEIEDLQDKVDEIKSSIEPDVSQPHRWAVQENLARLTRPRTVHIIPVVSRIAAKKAALTLATLSTARSVSKVIEDLWEALRDIDKNVPRIAMLANAFLGLGAMVSTSSSNLFALSQSLAQIGPLALALPGIFGGMAIGLGATYAVFKDFNKVLPEVKQNFKRLQDTMSVNFWSKAKAPIKSMIDTLFPEFEAGMQRTSEHLGIFFGNMADSFREKFSGALGPMFDDLNRSITIASGATDGIAGSIRTLGTVGASYLPRLATFFKQIADEFDAWLADAAKDGRLKQWIDTAIFQLKELGRLIAGLGSLLAGIARAANKAGGSTLTDVANTLQKAADVVNGPTFQKALIGVFKAAHKAIAIITDKAGPAFQSFMLRLADTLQQILPIVGDALGSAFKAIFESLDQPEVQRGVVAMFDGLRDGIKALAPALPHVGRALGAIARVIGTLAETLGPVLAEVLTVLADAIAKIAPALEPAIEALGGALLEVIKKLEPVIPKVTDAIVWLLEQIAKHPMVALGIAAGLAAMSFAFSAISSALGPVMPLLGSLVSAILPILGEVLVALGPWLFPIAAAFFTVAAALGSLAWGFINALRESKPLRDTLSDLWNNVLVPLGKTAWEQAKRIWPGIKQAFEDFTDTATQFWIDAQPALQGFVDFLKRHMPFIKNIVSAGFTALGWAIEGVFYSLSFLMDLIKGSLKSLKMFIDVMGKVKGAVFGFRDDVSGGSKGGGHGVLWTAGVGIMDSLIGGIMSKLYGSSTNTLQGVLGYITSFIPKHKGPPSTDKTLLHNAGQLIMDGFINGLESRYDAVRDSLSGLTRQIGRTDMGILGVAAGARVQAALASGPAGGSVNKTLNYYAAPGTSLGAEEDLFAAAERTRMVGW